MKKIAFAGLFFCVFLAALLFRTAYLERRPMHHDEANQAVKFGILLEKGEYLYDKADHHGPSLYYLTLPAAWLFSQKTLASLDERTLRLVPAFFGSFLLFLFLIVRKEMGDLGVFFSGLLLAFSPAFVYYSRFYIQEMLLVFFLTGFLTALWLCFRKSSLCWAVLAGSMAGMMYATKETAVICFVAALGGAGLSLPWLHKNKKKGERSLEKRVISLLAGTLAFFFITWLFYSSFFQNPAGWADSVQSFGGYFDKASRPDMHAHPWFYYLKLLSFSGSSHGPIWSEGFILGMALLGSVSAFKQRRTEDQPSPFVKFIFFYTLICTLFFSFISYKTPWNMLPFYTGMILLAGAGMSFLVQIFKRPKQRLTVAVLLVLGFFHLGLQGYRSSFVFFADTRNPYVYAQTSTDFLNLFQRVQGIASIHPDGRDMLVKVICGPYETWPLPWYLRQFGRVGYWQDVGEAGRLEEVPLIISSMEKLDELPPEIQDSYLQEFYGLRPEVPLAVFIRRDLWKTFLERRKN